MTDLVQKIRKVAKKINWKRDKYGSVVYRSGKAVVLQGVGVGTSDQWNRVTDLLLTLNRLLSEAADEIEFMREVLQNHGRTLPHGKDECDWCSRELKETP